MLAFYFLRACFVSSKGHNSDDTDETHERKVKVYKNHINYRNDLTILLVTMPSKASTTDDANRFAGSYN